MAKIIIPKSEKTIKKEERLARIEAKRNDNKEPSNAELKELLLDILEEIKEG